VVSGSPRISSSSPSPQRKMAQSRPQSVAIQKRAPNKSRAPWPSTSSPATTSNLNRPGPKPLAQSHGEEIESRRNAGGSRSAGVSEPFLLTDAERRKKEAQDSKRESEQCFDFLLDVRDMEGRRKGVDPDYDRRTILVPQKAKDQFTAFERQFWEIKQYHYDTVLFFQKGKFYELYEDDAVIGHRDFDLKLTDRVKMKMVSDRTTWR